MDDHEIREEAQEIFRRLDKLAEAIQKSSSEGKKQRIKAIRKAQDLIVCAEA
jgi:predicted transcriptional regulator